MKFGLREIMFLMVLLAMPVSSWWFVFRPQNQEIAKAKNEIEQKERMLDKLDKATAASADLARANAEIADGISMIESRLPTTKEVEVILEQVADIARQSRLVLPAVRTQAPVPSAKYMELPLEMKIRGDFDDFYTFLLKLEQLDRITRLPNLSMEKVEEVNGEMEATFILSIYFLPEKTGGA